MPKKKRKGRSKAAERARQRAQRRQNKGGANYVNLPKGVEFFDPKVGKNYLDIVPYVVTVDNHPDEVPEGDYTYVRTFAVHRGIGPDEKKFLCLRSIGKKCPICTYRSKLMKNGSDDEIIDALRPTERDLFVVLDDGKLKVMEFSNYLFGSLLDEEIMESDEDEGIDGFFELEGGLTVIARFVEESFGGGKFLKCKNISFQERDDLDEDLLEQAPDLDSCLVALDYKKLEAILLETEEAEKEDVDDEDDDADEPPRTRKKSKAEPKPEPEDDEDEDEEEYDDSEDDDDDDDDEEEYDDDEDEEDELEPGMMYCVACEGTGKNSKGKKCRICKGTGIVPDPDYEDDEDDDEDEDEEAEGECPHGFKFGHDCDTKEECDDCDMWAECRDLADELE